MDGSLTPEKPAYIDAMSLYEVIIALSHEQGDDWYVWSADTARFVTLNLIQPTRFVAVPPPDYTPGAGRRGLYAQMLDNLQGCIMLGEMVDADVKDVALSLLKEWCRQEAIAVAKYLHDTKNDPSYECWLEKNVEVAWTEHTATLQGLFEQDLIPVFAEVLNVSAKELTEVHIKSSQQRVVEQYAKSVLPRDGAYDLMQAAYTVSALLRGRYYGLIAVLQGLDLAYHPGRHRFVCDLQQGTNTTITYSDTAIALTEVILRAALREKNISNRLRLWAENIKKCKNAGTKLDLRSHDTWTETLKALAVNIKRFDLQIYPKWMEHVSSVVVGRTLAQIAGGVGLFALWKHPTLIQATTWAAAAGLAYVNSKYQFPKRVIRALESRTSRISDLAGYAPGGIRPTILVGQ